MAATGAHGGRGAGGRTKGGGLEEWRMSKAGEGGRGQVAYR